MLINKGFIRNLRIPVKYCYHTEALKFSFSINHILEVATHQRKMDTCIEVAQKAMRFRRVTAKMSSLYTTMTAPINSFDWKKQNIKLSEILQVHTIFCLFFSFV